MTVTVQNVTTLTSLVTVDVSPSSSGISSEGGKFVALNGGTKANIQTQLVWIGIVLPFGLLLIP
jgi:hypothetical protein